jgi:hypothetical protein
VLRTSRLRAAAPLTALIVVAVLAGMASPAQAAAVGPDAAGSGPDSVAAPAGRSTPFTVRSATTEQIRRMAADGDGQMITLGAPAAKARTAGDSAAIAAGSVTCYLDMLGPYGGGAYNAPIYVDGVVYCDDYVHLVVLTVELYRGLDRVANTTATYAYVYGAYASARYPTCDEGVYVGIVGATVARYDLNPPSDTANIISYPTYIGCAPPPPPPSAPLVVANPGNRRSLDGNFERLQMTATGGTPPYTWSATGLPSGLSIDSSTGLISGTTGIGVGGYTVTVTAVDAAGRSASTQFTWIVGRDACPRC